MDKPIYEHDCNECTFLGNYECEGTEYDLYFCKQNDMIDTVIARFGTDASYMSGMSTGMNDLLNGRENSPLATAFKRAYEKQLINVVLTPSK